MKPPHETAAWNRHRSQLLVVALDETAAEAAKEGGIATYLVPAADRRVAAAWQPCGTAMRPPCETTMGSPCGRHVTGTGSTCDRLQPETPCGRRMAGV